MEPMGPRLRIAAILFAILFMLISAAAGFYVVLDYVGSPRGESEDTEPTLKKVRFLLIAMAALFPSSIWLAVSAYRRDGFPFQHVASYAALQSGVSGVLKGLGALEWFWIVGSSLLLFYGLTEWWICRRRHSHEVKASEPPIAPASLP